MNQMEFLKKVYVTQKKTGKREERNRKQNKQNKTAVLINRSTIILNVNDINILAKR